MELGDKAWPVTRGQLDIWLAQETSNSETEWQLGLFVEIDGAVEREALEWAIRRTVGEAEPLRAGFVEENGQIYQRPSDYADFELDFFDVSQAGQPMREAREIASSIQRTPMPLTGQLFKFALFEAKTDETYLFVCCHHIVMDGYGLALVCRRIASLYSAIVSGAPIPTPIFGSLQDLLDCESDYENSNSYAEDQDYWTASLSAAAEADHRLPEAVGERDSRRSIWAGSAGSRDPPPRRAAVPGMGHTPIDGDHRGVRVADSALVRRRRRGRPRLPGQSARSAGVEDPPRDGRGGSAVGATGFAGVVGGRFLRARRHAYP